jgi:hypothetical protein
VIVSGTPKREIQVKVEAFAHAAADISERGMASIHLDMRSIMENIIKLITVLQKAHQINMQVRKMPLGDGDGEGDQACVAVDLSLLAGQTPTGPAGDIAGKTAPHKPR